jgi:hypothetical protein
MSSDFSTVLVKDARLAGITDQLTYAVQSGASSNTYQEFVAIGPSNSQLAFNIQVPSENVVVSREIFLKATIKFTVHFDAAAVASVATTNAVTPNRGGPGGFAFNAFPLNQLINTATAQINNTNVSANTQDILPILLQLADQNDLYTYDDTTAACVDRVVSEYADVLATASIHPFNNMFNADADGVKRGRGIPQLKVRHIISHAVAGDTGTAGSYNISATTPETTEFDIACEAELIEPIIGLSPFTYGNNQFNKAGLVGINSMNIVLNIDGTLSRLLGTSAAVTAGSGAKITVKAGWTTASGATASTQLFDKASLLVNFLSSQPTDLIPARNIVPYVDLPRYITQAGGSIASAALSTAATGGVFRIVPTTASITSSNIQLNQLPDYFIIAARIPPTNPTYYPNGKPMSAAPSFMGINSISVNLNNTSGLLSSATSSDLYRISIANHSNQTFSAWSGSYLADQGITDAGAQTQPKEYPSVGSILVLNPAKDLSLPDYLSSGSLGSFNFQFTLNVSNYHIIGTAFTPEIIVIAVNSGIFTTIAGSSNIFTGLLTKSMVLDAKKDGAEDPINAVQYERLAGGAMMPNSSAKEMSVVKDYKKMKGMGVRSGGGVSTGGRADRFAHLTTN